MWYLFYQQPWMFSGNVVDKIFTTPEHFLTAITFYICERYPCPMLVLLANNCTLCVSDAKARKQCKSNLFKKQKNRTARLALTQPSVIYRQLQPVADR